MSNARILVEVLTIIVTAIIFYLSGMHSRDFTIQTLSDAWHEAEKDRDRYKEAVDSYVNDKKAVSIDWRQRELEVSKLLTEISHATGIDLVELPSFGVICLDQEKAKNDILQSILRNEEDEDVKIVQFPMMEDWKEDSGLYED